MYSLLVFWLCGILHGFYAITAPQTLAHPTNRIGQAHDSLSSADRKADSLFIAEVQDRKNPDKVLHAEPLFIDLIRDLGARKGEAEWNAGFGLTDRTTYDQYSLLVEYEWAPIDRLGLELEIPMTLYSGNNSLPSSDPPPSNRLESLKFAAQYSFFVSEELATSLAVGYINELEFADINAFGKQPLFKANLYNPFFIAARRWGNNVHTLVYTGARFHQHFGGKLDAAWEIHTSLHYMISGTRNFIGLEMNKFLHHNTFDICAQYAGKISKSVALFKAQYDSTLRFF